MGLVYVVSDGAIAYHDLRSCTIKMNPLRANMVKHPAEYPWSSYRHNALGESDNLIVPHALYKNLGRSTTARQQGYRDLFAAEIEETTLNAIREPTNKAWVLGSEDFKEKLHIN